MKISLLSNSKSPLLGHTIQELLKNKIQIDSIIFDKREESEHTLELYHQRTNGKLNFIPMDQFEGFQVPIFLVDNHNAEEAVQIVNDRHIDLLVNAGTRRILKNNILKAPSIGVLNAHPGLMPQFRGCNNLEWAIYLNEKVGVTVHLMSESIDKGPIILQESLIFKKDDNYYEIRMKVYQLWFRMLARSIIKIISQKDTINDMDLSGEGRYFKKMPKNLLSEIINNVNKGKFKYQLTNLRK